MSNQFLFLNFKKIKWEEVIDDRPESCTSELLIMFKWNVQTGNRT